MEELMDINATPVHTDTVTVSIVDIKTWLKEGVTRRVGDPGYNASVGSIQEKYAMSKAEVTALFQDSRLKGLKVTTPKPSRIIIAEDVIPSNGGSTESPEAGGVPATPVGVLTQSNSSATGEVSPESGVTIGGVVYMEPTGTRAEVVADDTETVFRNEDTSEGVDLEEEF